MVGVRTRGWLPLGLAAVLLFPAAATAASAEPISPAAGALVRVTPKAGFANGTLPLRWSVEYGDCPAGSPTRSSAEFRVVDPNPPNWVGGGGGPFLGPGTFSAAANVFPQAVPVKYQWRVSWWCGATGGFAGAQGRSRVVTFTVLPYCARLAGADRTRCTARGKLTSQLKQCAKLRVAVERKACIKRANAAYARAIRTG